MSSIDIHSRDCKGGCRGSGRIQTLIPPEKRPAICYDHWDKYDFAPCDKGIGNLKEESNKTISIIVAMVPGTRIIGNENKIPWRIPSDLKRFKEITTNHPVVMGRKTYESIISYLKKPLPNRTNIVITRDKSYSAPGCIVVNDISSAFFACESLKTEKIFVIGGTNIYKQTLDFADELLVSYVHGSFEGDTKFPDFSKEWKMDSSEHCEKGPKDDCDHSFCVFRRKKPL